MNRPAVKTENLCFSYGEKQILKGMDLAFEAGTLTAVLGPNGSGKTTLLRLLDGLLKPDNGQIFLGNTPLHTLSRRALAQNIAYLPQDRPVPDISADMLVSYGRFPHLGFSGKLSAEDRRIVENAMRQTNTLGFAGRPLRTLSGGERQRVYIAMLLAQDADILLLDEPTAALDAQHKFEILKLLRTLSESGRTVITVLHDLPLAFTYADRLLLLQDGQCAAMGTAEKLYAEKAADRVFGIRLLRTETEGHTVWAERSEC